MSLVPKSLFSRLVLLLLAVLVTAQLVSLAIHLHERGRLLEEASGMQSAQRIAEVVRLLDTMDRDSRSRVATLLSAPSMSIRLDAKPAAVVEQDTGDRARAALFGAMLRRSLGDQWPVEVAAVRGSAPVPFPHGPHKGPAWMAQHAPMAQLAHGAIAFVAQVRLHDGSLVTFDSMQPAETASWPYRLLASLAVLLVAVMGVSLVAVRWVTRPLNALAEAAEGLGNDINRPPMPEEGPQEVVRAARAFNTMQRRLVRYIQDRTRVLAAMSTGFAGSPVSRPRR